MYKKILLAYNATAHSRFALRQAAELAKLCHAQLHMLGIVVTTGGITIAQSTSSIDLLSEEHKRIEQALVAVSAELRLREIDVMTYKAQGEPSVIITSHAAKIGADLIVIGHTSRTLLARWFQSSTGAKLLDNLACSLLIANPTREL